MSAFAKRIRLNLTRLADRTVPSTVTATTTARPFDFTATGTLTTSTIDTSGSAPLTTTDTTAVTLNGELDYTDQDNGTASLVGLSGAGTGNQPGGRDSFAETTQGQLALTDTDGIITTPTPLTANVNWMTPSNATGIDLLGPQNATGTFDTSNFQLNAGWTNADGSTGSLTATLAPKSSSPTDLSISNETLTVEPDGTLTLDFTANATGNLIPSTLVPINPTAPNTTSHDFPVAAITAQWQSADGTFQQTDLDVPVYWNTGQIVVHDTELTPPSWATSLKVSIDAANAVAESDETNNDWTGTFSNPNAVPPPVAPPPAPPPTVASFAVVPGTAAAPAAQIQWLAANGTVLAQTTAIPDFNGAVAIASADINGDGIPDLAVAAGSGGGPRVRVLDGKTGDVIADFFAFDASFRGGASIALGDLDGNGKLELVAGAGNGGGPQVSVFDPLTGQLQNAFFAYDSSGRGGVSVAAANLNLPDIEAVPLSDPGDAAAPSGGAAQIITAPGPGEGNTLEVFDGNGSAIFQSVLPIGANSGAAVSTSLDPASGAMVVTVAPDDGSALVKFRSQLAASEPLLTALPPDEGSLPPPVAPSPPPPPPPASNFTLMGGSLISETPPPTTSTPGMTLSNGVLTGIPLPAPKPSGLTLVGDQLE